MTETGTKLCRVMRGAFNLRVRTLAVQCLENQTDFQTLLGRFPDKSHWWEVKQIFVLYDV